MRIPRLALLLAAAAPIATSLLAPTAALGGAAPLPVVPGASVTVYAEVTDPVALSFALAGDLYVGRDAGGSPPGTSGDPVKIHRIGAGGSPVVEYGDDAIDDPDGVLFDENGVVSGTVGAVIVAGQAFGVDEGRISAILPDGSVIELVAPTATLGNPGYLAAVEVDQVVVADPARGVLFDLAPAGSVTPLVGPPLPATPVDVDSHYTSLVYAGFGDGSLRIYGNDGSVVDPGFATGLGPEGVIAVSPGGEWGTGVYAVDAAGNLVRVEANDEPPVIVGTGFAGIFDLAFGPDGALFVSDHVNDRIVRIAQLGLDAFLCYKAKPTKGGAPFVASTVQLEDLLGTVSARVVKPRALCSPADRAGAGIADAESHLASFGIQPDPKPPKLTGVDVENVLGELTVDLTKLDRLLVPAAASEGGPVPPLVSTEVGHFACYKAKVAKGTPKLPKGTQVSVADEFAATRTFDVKKPTRVCLGTDRDGGGIPRPGDDLACYQVKPAKGQPKHAKRAGVHVNHAFGAAQLDTVKEEELCLPSNVGTAN